MRKLWDNSEVFSMVFGILIAAALILIIVAQAQNLYNSPQIVVEQPNFDEFRHIFAESGEATDEAIYEILERLSELTEEIESIRQSHEDLLSALTGMVYSENGVEQSNFVLGDYYVPSLSDRTFLDYFELTFYCTCYICCGTFSAEYQHAAGNLGFVQTTANGRIPTVGRTVAAPSRFAFGTELYIEGWGWHVVEDRGSAVTGNILDIYVGCHATALRHGRRPNVRVYQAN